MKPDDDKIEIEEDDKQNVIVKVNGIRECKEIVCNNFDFKKSNIEYEFIITT